MAKRRPLFPRIGFCTEGGFRLYGPPDGGEPGIETHRRMCADLAAIGYNCFELVAPTLAEDPTTLSEDDCKPFVEAATDVGGRNSGLHWLLAGTDGHMTNPAAHDRTVGHIVRLARLTRWLGGLVNVHGSPGQRNLLWDQTYPDAFQQAAKVYAAAVPQIKPLGVKVCIEQLAPNETNMWGSLAEVERFIHAVNSLVGEDLEVLFFIIDIKALLFTPGVRFPDDVVTAIRKYGPRVAHVHLNTRNLGGPGCDDLDFGPIFQALYDIEYHEPWRVTGEPRVLSVEVFNAKQVPLLETAQRSWDTIAKWQPA